MTATLRSSIVDVQGDVRAFRAVLRGVVKQVGNDLRQPCRIAVQPDRRRSGMFTLRVWWRLSISRLDGLHAVRDDLVEVDRLALQA